jgi:hypothetical protein
MRRLASNQHTIFRSARFKDGGATYLLYCAVILGRLTVDQLTTTWLPAVDSNHDFRVQSPALDR